MLTVRIALPSATYGQAGQVVNFYSRRVERLQVTAGMKAAGVARSLPLGPPLATRPRCRRLRGAAGHNAKGDWQIVSDGAFEAMGTRFMRGRWFTADRHAATSQPVAVVNETLARTYCKRRRCVGGRIRVGTDGESVGTVVGIVADERHNGVTGAVKEKFYIPYSQWHVVTGGNLVRNAFVVVRTTGDPDARWPGRFAARSAASIRQLPVAQRAAMSDVVSTALATPRLTGFLLGSVCGDRAGAGGGGHLRRARLCGVAAHTEIGIRIALGSERHRVISLIVRQGMSLGSRRHLRRRPCRARVLQRFRGLLYQVEPTDAATFGATGVILLLIALSASARACVARRPDEPSRGVEVGVTARSSFHHDRHGGTIQPC